MASMYENFITNGNNSKRTQRACLSINTKNYPIYDGLNPVGRNTSATVNIKNVNISHVHAIITVVDESKFYISDFKSSNRTTVNGQCLEPFVLYPLEDQDDITFADIQAVFKFLVNENGHCDNDGATQEVTQTFYSSHTQIMDNSRDVDIHDMATQVEFHRRVHEMPTQLFTFNSSENIVRTRVEDETDHSKGATAMQKSPGSNVSKAGPSHQPEREICSQVSDDQPKFSRLKKINVIMDSDEDLTDAEDEIITSRPKISASKRNPLDSDSNDIDDTSPAKSKDESEIDKETKIEAPTDYDKVQIHNTDSSSDNETDIEEDSGKLNDTDLIPCTQEVAQFKSSKPIVDESILTGVGDDEIVDSFLDDSAKPESFKEVDTHGEVGSAESNPKSRSDSLDHSYAITEELIKSKEQSVIDWITEPTTAHLPVDMSDQQPNEIVDHVYSNENKDGVSPKLLEPEINNEDIEDSRDFYLNPTQRLIPDNEHEEEPETVDDIYIQATQAVHLQKDKSDKVLEDNKLSLISDNEHQREMQLEDEILDQSTEPPLFENEHGKNQKVKNYQDEGSDGREPSLSECENLEKMEAPQTSNLQKNQNDESFTSHNKHEMEGEPSVPQLPQLMTSDNNQYKQSDDEHGKERDPDNAIIDRNNQNDEGSEGEERIPSSDTKRAEEQDFEVQPQSLTLQTDQNEHEGSEETLQLPIPENETRIEAEPSISLKNDAVESPKPGGSSDDVFLHPESPNRKLDTLTTKEKPVNVVVEAKPKIRNVSSSLEDELEMMFASQRVMFPATQQLVDILEDGMDHDDKRTDQRSNDTTKKERKTAAVEEEEDICTPTTSSSNQRKSGRKRIQKNLKIESPEPKISKKSTEANLKEKKKPLKLLENDASSSNNKQGGRKCKTTMSKSTEDENTKPKPEPKPSTSSSILHHDSDDDDDDFEDSSPKVKLMSPPKKSVGRPPKGRTTLRKNDSKLLQELSSDDNESKDSSRMGSSTSLIGKRMTTRKSKSVSDSNEKMKITATITNNKLSSIAEDREVEIGKAPANIKAATRGRKKVEDDGDFEAPSSSTSTSQCGRSRRLSAHSKSLVKAQTEAKASASARVAKKRASSPIAEERVRKSPRTSGEIFMIPQERNKRKLKPKVVFTMMDSPELESLIKQLGGTVVGDVDSCTVLVTENVKRSNKLLTAVGQAKPICSPEWLYECKRSSTFLDPWDFVMVDEVAEEKWDFSLRESLQRSKNTKLFANYTFLILIPSSNAVDVLKGAITASGGKCIMRGAPKNSEDSFVIVATADQRARFSKVMKTHPRAIVVEPEAVFDGSLRQEIRFENHIIK